MLENLLYAALAVIVLFIVFWLISIPIGIWNTIDIAYGMAFPLYAAVAWYISGIGELDLFNKKLIVTVLTVLWGLRIAIFLTIRKYGKDKITGEDKRFVKFRENWGQGAWWKSLFGLYMTNIIVVLIVGYPLIIINSQPTAEWMPLDNIGLLIWIFGFLFETIADFQLLRFKNKLENKGKIYTDGLWKYSRHPNYFGEITQWVGIFILALTSTDILVGFTAIISPIFITLLLLRVSGINLLEEERFDADDEYAEYKRKTSALIPKPPSKTEI